MTTMTTHPTAPPRAGLRGWAALVVLMLPVFVVSMDNTALSFAVPQLATSLQPSAKQLLWIVDVYPLILAGLLITMGMLGDRIGRRRLLMLGTAGFGAVSIYAAFAPSADHLIAARVLLGVFGATLMPSTLSLLRNVFLHDGERRLAIAVWASGFSGGSALGPIVGGWLIEHFWWGAIFLISLPAALVLLATGPFLLPESRNPDAGRLDLWSVALSIAAMMPIVYAIKHSAMEGLDLLGVTTAAAGLAAGAIFVHRQLTRTDPLLDLRLFTRPVFAASIAANFLSIFAFAGLIFFLSQHLQFVEGKTPIQAAIALIPGAVASIVVGLLAVALARAVAVHHLVGLGILLACAGYLVGSTMTVDSPAYVIVVVFVLVGAGAGLAETLTNDAILASVPAQRAGAASGISETAYELGAALGVAVLGSLLTSVYRSSIVIPRRLPASARDEVQNMIGTAMAAADTLPGPLAQATRLAAQRAFEAGVAATSLAGAVLTGVTAVVVWWVLRRDAHRSDLTR